MGKALLKSAWLVFALMLAAVIAEQFVARDDPTALAFSGIVGGLVALTIIDFISSAEED